MKRVFERWFECEDGHITAGNNKKTKCDAELWQLNYVKGKRKGQWIEEKTKVPPCGKKIVSEGEIPPEIDYTKIWDYKTCHAFLIGQKLDAELIVGLQTAFVKFKEALDKHTHEIPR